ncbi:recombinase family protein [Novosphingobium sp.]|uniref:recombinase family protein n=1 Tax=Novosphingobium sp. TaxID=1874826 RepID=UPI003BA97AC8
MQTGAVRCAIYTRKSTEEGLEQAFNSLDAQREACAAYILSQQHEGWTMLPDVYDDGGFSGGSINRPALQRLLDAVEQGNVDVIVVYKVDRLTRSLADFAKIVEVLDGAGASFVSVTQAFNTTNSMGRLTLNVLLSFAQFEREVTGERIRDKIAASKKKGMWMGGPIPVGYDVRDRVLVVNEAEAATVRLIFALHSEFPTLAALTSELERRGIKSRVRMMRDGRIVGGKPYKPGAIRHVLKNRIYLGETCHGDKVYKGAHDAIVDRKVWEEGQIRLTSLGTRPRSGLVSPLAGRIKDADGNPLIAAHANRSGRRYRYYTTKSSASADAWRLPAGDLETMVHRAIDSLLDDPFRLAAEFGAADARLTIAARHDDVIANLRRPSALAAMLEALDARIVMSAATLRIKIGRSELANLFAISLPASGITDCIDIEVPTSLRRRGHELRLVYSNPDARPVNRDGKLIELLGKGWAAWQQINTEPWIEDATKRSHLCRLARLRFLAPDIVTAIIDGRQPIELTARRLLRVSELPEDWTEQRTALGFSADNKTA